MLTTAQAVGNLAASAVAELLYTFASPTVAFGYLAAWMLIALLLLLPQARTALGTNWTLHDLRWECRSGRGWRHR